MDLEPEGASSSSTGGTTVGADTRLDPGTTTTSTDPGTTTAPSTTGSADASTAYDTDYPIEPGCDGGDESYGGYIEPDPGSGGGESGNTSGVEETGVGMGDIPLGATVFEVQQGMHPAGTYVQLEDVVVTAPKVLDDDGSSELVFVQEHDGGPESGIVVRFPVGDSVRSDVKMRDRVAITGVVVDRYVFKTIEVRAASGAVSALGVAALPPPVGVTPTMLEPGSASAKLLESVPVEIRDVLLVDPDPCDGEVEVQSSLRLDDRFLRLIGENIPLPPEGLYVQVRGPLIYTYRGFEIAPRNLDDVLF